MANISQFVTNFFDWSLITDSFESDVAIGTAAAQLIQTNPRRLALHLTNTTAITIAISRVLAVSLTSGLLIAPGETVDLYWYNELREIERNWFAIAGMAGASIHMREVVFV